MATKKSMSVLGMGLALLLLGWQAYPALGQSPDDTLSTGVVATITVINAKTCMATLQTEAGEVFALPKESLWKVGGKVECDRIPWSRGPRLQHCQPWQVQEARDTAAQRAQTTSSK